MSYKHLAGRLIETQRSMLGEPAIDVARSTEGITVTDDGTVTAVEGDSRVVVDELARRYTNMLGTAAETRLRAAAREFEDELALPPSLGGTADAAAVSDGGAVEALSSDRDAQAETRSPTLVTAADTDAETDDDTARITLEDPVTARYAVASDLASVDDAAADLASVYLLPDSADGWQGPVTVEEAVVDAVADATDRDPAGVGDATDPVDVNQLLATLRGEADETVSFELVDALAGLTVTFHHTGALAVH
jgi:hypothetical protein